MSSKENAAQLPKHKQLHLAIMEDDGFKIWNLLQDEVDVNVPSHKGFTPLLIAALKNQDGVVQMLISAKAEIDHSENQGGTALFIAAQLGFKRVVQALLQAKASTNIALPNGQTALMAAAYFGCDDTTTQCPEKHQSHSMIVRLLICSKANLSYSLQLAQKCDKPTEVSSFLLEQKRQLEQPKQDAKITK